MAPSVQTEAQAPVSVTITAGEARARGLSRYYTGRACPHGHVCERLVANNVCVQCRTMKTAAWRSRNREHVNQQNAARMAAKKAQYRPTAQGWYYERGGQEYCARRYAARRAEVAAYLKQRRKDSPEVFRERRARRRAIERSATPAWVDVAALKAVYAQAVQLERDLGDRYEVDHIVPLAHESVCGLHVPWNLQIVTRSENRVKCNRFEGRGSRCR